MTMRQALEQVARETEQEVDLGLYPDGVLDEVTEVLEGYLGQKKSRPSRWWRRAAPESTRVDPLLLSGPTGTGKTTLLLLLDRALPGASIAPLFEQEIPAHPTARSPDGQPLPITLRPLRLMGRSRNFATGVLRLSELQRFYRLFTYDRERSRTDPAAADRFAAQFLDRVVYVDEFVPDEVSAFPMRVINHLADHGVQLILTSNRSAAPFIDGVRVVPVQGDDLRRGSLDRILLPPGPSPLFDRAAAAPFRSLERVSRTLTARVVSEGGREWLYFPFDLLAHVPLGWNGFQRLLAEGDGILIDEVTLFRPGREVSPDAARRIVLLVYALYDERVPVRMRLATGSQLPAPGRVGARWPAYPSEIRTDLERMRSRLRQLSTLVAPPDVHPPAV